jgi:hypothetical protein
MFRMVTKQMFFDRRAVTRRVDRTVRRVLSRFGAFVRTTARHSIRQRKSASEPGSPPSSHVGLLRRLIYFGYERVRRSVVIGPERLNQKVGDAPHALEHGGISTVMEGRRRQRRKRRVKIAARPFMGPAFEQERPKLPAMWANSIRA